VRVGCLGNMNNMFFALVRHLRDRGVDAHLVMQPDELAHFHPSHDSFDLGYQAFTTQARWRGPFLDVPPEAIAKDLEPYDFLVVTGILLAYVERAGRVADVFFPHGSDLFKWPFVPDTMRWDQRLRSRSVVAMFRAQRAGIRHAFVINQEDRNPFWRRALERHDALDRTVYFGTPMVYGPPFLGPRAADARSRSAWFREFAAIRERSGLMVINHARQQWRTTADCPSKGSDRLIRGFADFAKRHPAVHAALVLFEYGDDVIDSRELVDSLGILESVHWMPLMSRKEILLGLSLADFGCGEFHEGCIGGGTTWEVLALGKPLLHYVDQANVNFDCFTGAYPVLSVKEPSEIAAVFEDFSRRPEHYRAIGEAGKAWYEENFVNRSVDTYIELIRAKERGEDLLVTAKNFTRRDHGAEPSLLDSTGPTP